MPLDHANEYEQYLQRFRRLVGDRKPGQYGRFQSRLVLMMNGGQFTEKLDEYQQLGNRFGAMVTSGDTIDERLVAELRAAEIELVLEESRFLPPRSFGRWND